MAKNVIEEIADIWHMVVQAGRGALLKALKTHVQEWKGLLQRFLKNEDDQVRLLQLSQLSHGLQWARSEMVPARV